MIYLFEDRIKRKEEYLPKDFSHVNLKFANFNLTEDMDIQQYVQSQYGNAEAVIFHASYDLKNCLPDEVREAFMNMNIPFIYFSGGMESGDYYLGHNGKYLVNVNSAIMYKNLGLFLSKYDTSKELDPRVLLLGQNPTLNEGLKFLKISEIFLSNCGEIISKKNLRDFKARVLDIYLEGKEFEELKNNISLIVESGQEIEKSKFYYETDKIKLII
jgi:hypothetical protein